MSDDDSANHPRFASTEHVEPMEALIEAAHQRIEELFGVDVRPELRLWRIAEQIKFRS